MLIKLKETSGANVTINTQFVQYYFETENGFLISFQNGDSIQIKRPLSEFENIMKSHGLRLINIV